MGIGTFGTVVRTVKKGLEITVEAAEAAAKAIGTAVETGELRLPALREVAIAYAMAQSAWEVQEVYQPLMRKYPSLQSVIEEMRQANPVSSMDGIAKTIIKLQGAVRLKRLAYGAGNAPLPTGLPAVERKLADASRLAMEWLPRQQAFYVHIAREANALAKARGIAAVDAVAETAYRDKVLPRVFPKRQDAETYFRDEEDLGARLRSVTGELITAARRAGLVTEELPAVKLPTPAAQSALKEARAEYRQQRLERAYVKR